jgi:hypothetical protein
MTSHNGNDSVSSSEMYTRFCKAYIAMCMKTFIHVRQFSIQKNIFKERYSRVLNILSYSGGPEFKSRPVHRLSLLRFFTIFQSLQETAGIIP